MKQGRGEMMGTERERKAGLTKALVLSASFDLMEETFMKTPGLLEQKGNNCKLQKTEKYIPLTKKDNFCWTQVTEVQ